MCGFVALLGGNNQENKIHINSMLDEIVIEVPMVEEQFVLMKIQILVTSD